MKSILLIFLFLSFTSSQEEFYQIFSNNSFEEINEKINSLSQIKNKTIIEEAYIAALLMKKSSFEKDLKVKIKTFKKGALILEELIETNQENVELKFIRLIIQENSPKILKYNTKIVEDSNFIKSRFKNLNKILQKEIENYSEISVSLDLE